MSNVIKIAKAVAFIWMASAPVFAWASRGYIYDSAGSVSVAIGKDAPHPALKNDTITSGVTIRTGDNSHAVLKFEDGQVVSLQANSTLLVREYLYVPQQVEKSNIVFSMLKGGMRFVTGLIGQRDPKAFRLATPQATIGIRGTDFFAVLTNKGLYNQVSSGSISVTNAAGMSTFSAGKNALTTSSKALPVSISPMEVPAGTFREIVGIPVPSAVPGEIPSPVPVATLAPEPVPEPEPELAPVPAPEAIALPAAAPAAGSEALTSVAPESTAGGEAAGGAASAPTTEVVATGGASSTAIAVGVVVAAGVAALVTTSTTHH
jgi:hypothetical protein